MSGRARAGVIRDARGRRVREHDRDGAALATLAWAGDGRLAGATVRLPDGAWLRIEPRALHDEHWGVSDRLHHGDTTVTHFAAVNWARIDAIPPLAEPARLPPGGGTAVLNLVAALAADQGRDALVYTGPYPTEQLFLALLESFQWNYAGDGEPDPLAAFMAGALTWTPAPHTRTFAAGGVYVQSRERIEKVVWRGRAYYRTDWHGVERHATHRVHDAGERVHAGLWALGAALEDHVVLTPDGDVLEAREPAPDVEPPSAVPPAVTAGLVAVVVASSAPPLADMLREIGATLAVEWAPLSGDLAVLSGERARLSSRLRQALAARVAAAPARAEQVRLGLAALAELAHALGDALRARAQARLAAAPPEVQAAALRARSSAGAAAAAREIGQAVEALVADAAQLRA